MVSHELRTPLTALMGFIEIALLEIARRDRLPTSNREELITRVEDILKQASGQVDIETRMVEDLLEGSRLEMHQFELAVQKQNLVTIVQKAVANQRQLVQARQVELVLPSEKEVPVMVDAGRIGQVLTNYLTNALKYAPSDRVISVRLEVMASMARVSVRDEGPGLTLTQQQQVWERFYQAATPRHYGTDGGLGLGLAIAKGIIEQHQGQVGVESTPGQGSTFWFALQLADSNSRVKS